MAAARAGAVFALVVGVEGGHDRPSARAMAARTIIQARAHDRSTATCSPRSYAAATADSPTRRASGISGRTCAWNVFKNANPLLSPGNGGYGFSSAVIISAWKVVPGA